MAWICKKCGGEMVVRQYFSTAHKMKKDFSVNKTKIKGTFKQPSHMKELECSECSNSCTDSVLALEIDNMAHWED